MTVRVYRHSDTSAPVLTGQAGSLIGLLDAVLVNGYGSQPALGWTKPYNGSNLASYRMPTGSTHGFYLDVTNTVTNHATVRGYETMSAVNTGTNPFPTVAQSGTSVWTHSLEGVSSTPVNWVIVGTDKMFYLWIKLVSTHTQVAGGDYGVIHAFGQFLSYKPADGYNVFITTAPNTGNYYTYHYCSQTLSSQANGHWIARSHLGTVGSVAMSKVTDSVKNGGANMIGGGTSTNVLSYPNPVDSNLYMAPIWAGESVNLVLRGIIPGSYCPAHKHPLTTGATFAGTGTFTGKTFEVFSTANQPFNGTDNGQVFIEVSNTW